MIVASMLMSPMMSPILGFTFGSVVHDRDLFMRGLVTEAVGIALAFLVGFVMGLIMAPFRCVRVMGRGALRTPRTKCPRHAFGTTLNETSVMLASQTIPAVPSRSNEYSWPTSEMQSRGEEISLIVGLAFAIPSGAGVALSVTGGGGNSLVGVAIAASLLPPVVNTGICLAYAAVAKVRVCLDRARAAQVMSGRGDHRRAST